MGDAYGAGMINHVSTDLHELLDNEANGNVKNGNANGHAGENGFATTTTF
jgi:hypothetical protein